MFRKIFLFPCLIFSEAVITSNNISPAEINSLKELSELPLEKLLQVRQSFASSINRFDERLPYEHGPIGPNAQPLTGDNKKQLMRREYEHEWHKDEGGGKIRSAFHLAITTLAFLAFGGYLLCMIVQAVKNKGVYYPTQPQQPQTPMFLSFPPVKSKPSYPYGRKKRNAHGEEFPGSFHGTGNSTNEYHDTRKLAGILANENDMYHALIMLTESFAAQSRM